MAAAGRAGPAPGSEPAATSRAAAGQVSSLRNKSFLTVIRIYREKLRDGYMYVCTCLSLYVSCI